uniref:Uncharacterized protein n=1 Tax=Arundo donax TaxID=35708 RepID=A0A0A9CGP5_ARUDO
MVVLSTRNFSFLPIDIQI